MGGDGDTAALLQAIDAAGADVIELAALLDRSRTARPAAARPGHRSADDLAGSAGDGVAPPAARAGCDMGT